MWDWDKSTEEQSLQEQTGMSLATSQIKGNLSFWTNSCFLQTLPNVSDTSKVYHYHKAKCQTAPRVAISFAPPRWCNSIENVEPGYIQHTHQQKGIIFPPLSLKRQVHLMESCMKLRVTRPKSTQTLNYSFNTVIETTMKGLERCPHPQNTNKERTFQIIRLLGLTMHYYLLFKFHEVPPCLYASLAGGHRNPLPGWHQQNGWTSMCSVLKLA